MMQQDTMPAEGLPPMLKDLYTAVSPTAQSTWSLGS
jgi:hypothetical protein